jgi:hypothetical protein
MKGQIPELGEMRNIGSFTNLLLIPLFLFFSKVPGHFFICFLLQEGSEPCAHALSEEGSQSFITPPPPPQNWGGYPPPVYAFLTPYNPAQRAP